MGNINIINPYQVIKQLNTELNLTKEELEAAKYELKELKKLAKEKEKEEKKEKKNE